MAPAPKRQLKTIDDDDDLPSPGPWGASAPGNQLTVPDEEDEPQTDVDRVAELIRQSEGVGRAQVKVYKIENGISVFCESYSPTDFESGDYGMLRDNFGAGKFKIILYGNHPTTEKFGILTRGEITIAEIRKSESRMQNPIAAENGLNQVLASIAQGQAQMLDALISIKQAPQKDPMDEMTKMLSMMTMMRTAMGLDQPVSNKSPISEIVAAMREMRSVSEEFSPDKESAEPNLLSMLPQVLDIVKTGIANQQQAPQQQQPFPSISIPASLQPNPTPVQTEEDDVNIKEMLALRKNLSDLLAMAVEKKTPEEGAQFVYDSLPDDFVELMGDEKWFDMLGLIETKAHEHKEWLTETRNKALAMFEPADSPE